MFTLAVLKHGLPVLEGDVDVIAASNARAGDLAATYKLTATNLVDLPASPALSSKLDLTIQDLGSPCAASPRRCASRCSRTASRSA
ncbi:hypothetical protein [Baekduia alba]|uniref:hypothetical protein n=1 Tax=Baekduia alba TaxID=2997333 RepID=UPI0023416F54|nr:hypothetical protein [Baekduia alba]